MEINASLFEGCQEKQNSASPGTKRGTRGKGHAPPCFSPKSRFVASPGAFQRQSNGLRFLPPPERTQQSLLPGDQGKVVLTKNKRSCQSQETRPYRTIVACPASVCTTQLQAKTLGPQPKLPFSIFPGVFGQISRPVSTPSIYSVYSVGLSKFPTPTNPLPGLQRLHCVPAPKIGSFPSLSEDFS